MNYANQEKLGPILNALHAKRPLTFGALEEDQPRFSDEGVPGQAWPHHFERLLRAMYANSRLRIKHIHLDPLDPRQLLTYWGRQIASLELDLLITGFPPSLQAAYSFQQFRYFFDEIVNRCQSMGCAVLFRTPIPIDLEKASVVQETETYSAVQMQIAVLREVAQGRLTPFVDHFAMWRIAEAEGRLTTQTMQRSPQRLNDKGHRLVAEQLQPLFQLPLEDDLGD